MGAERSKFGLINEYDFRLGLSATPQRWFDTSGTDALYNFFGGVVYKFTLENAIKEINPITGRTYLTPYKYLPKFISLTSEELEEYVNTTLSIAKSFNRAKRDEE